MFSRRPSSYSGVSRVVHPVKRCVAEGPSPKMTLPSPSYKSGIARTDSLLKVDPSGLHSGLRELTLIFPNPLPAPNTPTLPLSHGWTFLQTPLPTTGSLICLSRKMDLSSLTTFCGEAPVFHSCLKEWNDPKYMNPISEMGSLLPYAKKRCLHSTPDEVSSYGYPRTEKCKLIPFCHRFTSYSCFQGSDTFRKASLLQRTIS